MEDVPPPLGSAEYCESLAVLQPALSLPVNEGGGESACRSRLLREARPARCGTGAGASASAGRAVMVTRLRASCTLHTRDG